MSLKIAVLAVQGAFIEHERILKELGAECFELRKSSDLERAYDGLVLPGGESTVQSKLLKELGMFDEIKGWIENGMPTLATCAGLILLAEHISGADESHFATLPVTVQRNAYGRQLGSFSANGILRGVNNQDKEFPLEFIRAPFIESVNDAGVESLVSISRFPDRMTFKDGSKTTGEQNIVGVKYKNQLGLAFHPELTNDYRIHEMFLSMMKH